MPTYRKGVTPWRCIVMRRVLAVVLVLAVPLAAYAYASSRPRPRPVVYAIDRHGHLLRSGATVRPGERLTVYARGFARGARMEVVDAARRRIAHVYAGRYGVARRKFVVPRTIKHHRRPLLAFAGRKHIRRPAPVRAGRPGKHVARANIVVTVPLLRRFTYRLVPRHRGSAVDALRIQLRDTAQTDRSGPLADTGFDLVALLLAALVLLVLGATLLFGGGRRR